VATTYTVDPTRFYAEGAVVDWARGARLLKFPDPDPQKLRPTIELRWMLRGDLGMPTEPFQVWARPHSPAGLEQPLTLKHTTLMFFFGYSLVTWPTNGSMSNVSVDVAAPSPDVIFGFAGGPVWPNMNSSVTIAAGASTVQLAAPVLDGLLVPTGVNVSAVRGIEINALSKAAGWVLIETVGIPVKKAAWAGIGQHGDPQGMVGALVDAPTAAVQRLGRGAPPFGWGPTLASQPAPPWSAPAFPALVGEVNKDLLDFVRAIVAGFPPNQQIAQRVTLSVPPPKNSAGASVNATSSDSKVSPLGMTLIAAASDPFLSLVLGFGTAYPYTTNAPVIAVPPRQDYMITAHWEKGLDGSGPPADFAAIVPAPGVALAPPPPANLSAEIVGMLKPLATDGEWRCTSRISWDKVPGAQLFRVASFAAARLGVTPPAPAAALMDVRPSGGFRPIAINSTDPAADPGWWRNNAIDRELPINTSPGNRSVTYGIAVQDIYGQWTPWGSIGEFMQEPPLDQVRLVSAKLTPAAPPSGSLCPATLEVEFLWDWSVRSPGHIQLAGILYAAADHGSPPPSVVVPGGLARSVGGANPLLDITWSGAVPSAAGATFIGLDPSGEKNVGFGAAAQGNEGRRYRMTLPGFSLDFALAGHIGLALWARAQERIPPTRVGPWSTNPLVVSTSDPRPPVVPVEHVTLASLADAAGECHARISWTPQPGATGYFIYESDETQILRALALHEPTPDQTLDDRLKVVKDHFSNIPRRCFTRLNASPLSGSSTDIAMPKGSTAIHFYIVLGISAGQVESGWPTDKDALIAVAAPHVMSPAPPTLEVQRYLDNATMPPEFKARLLIRTRPGPRVKKIDLHRVRVDDAATSLDTMGPPVARIEASSGPWTVTTAVDAHAVSYIQTVEGTDTPPGSWRRVWYRATAWTEKDDTRGGLPGRSPASTAGWVVLPPPGAPVVSALAAGGGPGPADIILEWTSASPIKRTPIGPHALSARAAVSGAPPKTAPLLSADAPLDKLGTSQPATGSGVWIVSTTAGVTKYRALIRRAALTDPVRFVVRITDPIGRTGEALADISAGPVDPAPDLGGLVVHKIPVPPPPKVLLEFWSTVPLKAPPDGPYLVRVTMLRKGPPFPPILPITVEMPVGSVPTSPPGPGAVMLALYRLAGSGPKITYVALSTALVDRFSIRITAPDGRVAEHTQVVS